jgi:hypothetical protein
MKRVAEIAQKREEFPYKNTPVQLCFEAEIKRVADEREEPMAEVLKKLSKFSGVGERQIYNYRMGKTELTPELIKIFCEQFNSIALGMSWLSTFDVEHKEHELYDLSRFASSTVCNVLQAGDRFLRAFEDSHIDGHELNELELAGAKIQRDATRMVEIARGAYKRSRTA